MALTTPRKSFAPESCPDELMKMLLEIHPPLTLAETSYHQRVYDCITEYFDLKQRKPEPTKPGELSDEAKRADKLAREGLNK